MGTESDGFYRHPGTIAKGTAAVNHEVGKNLGEPLSDQAWEDITHLSWRPAWSIRSRRGTWQVLLDWWRNDVNAGSSRR